MCGVWGKSQTVMWTGPPDILWDSCLIGQIRYLSKIEIWRFKNIKSETILLDFLDQHLDKCEHFNIWYGFSSGLAQVTKEIKHSASTRSLWWKNGKYVYIKFICRHNNPKLILCYSFNDHHWSLLTKQIQLGRPAQK